MHRQTSTHAPPPARKLLIRFGIVGVLVALFVVALLTAALVRVLTQAQDRIRDDLQAAVAEQLDTSSQQQADVMSQELATVHLSTEYLSAATADAFIDPVEPSAEEVARYGPGPNGSYVTTADNGGAAMYYSGYVPIGAAQKAKAGHVAAIDPALKAVVASNPLIVQAYLNTWDSLNRIYPYFDGASQYPPRMNIPEYNFYYEADEVHNPSKDVVWTGVYVDPAGMGWMVSAIDPVYVDGKLEGVVGADVTVEAIVGELLSSDQAYGSYSLLVDENGTIMAMPPQAETLLGLQELTSVDYATFVSEDTFKPEDFDIGEREDTADLSALMASSPAGQGRVEIAGRQTFVSYHTLPETGWQVVTIAEQSTIEALNQPADHLGDAVTAVVFLLALAAVALVILLTWRARVLSISFTRPLMAIDDATLRISKGEFRPTVPRAPIAELERTRRHLLEMGERLEAAQIRMLADAEQVRENEERYRTIFENVGEAVVTADANGTITDANEAAETLLDGQDPVGRSISEFIRDDMWREPGRHEVIFEQEDGPDLVYHLMVAAWGEADSVRYVVTVRDVTASRERQRLLEEARETAERTARLKDEFLASMSHEIRTPMNGVIGMLSLMAETDLTEEARGHLDVARRSAGDLLVLVNDVLDFSKLEADRVAVEPDDVAIDELLEGIMSLLAPMAAEQSDVLVVHIDDSVPAYLRLDPTRVRQVIVNLVSNALKFTTGGNVRVEATFDPTAESDAGESPDVADRGVLRITVRDDGDGIPETLQPRLFTRFSQGNPSVTQRFRGTGLGLAIVKRLVELMGGEVGFESTEGAGSTFWFTVEAQEGARPVPGDGEVARDRTELQPASAQERPLRVLIAEDNEVNQLLFVKMLERLGHVAVTVSDGQQAVDAVAQGRFDVVLMDVQMPVLSGVEATRAIRALEGEQSDIPILAITANVMADQQAAYIEAGMDGCLPKPLTITELSDGLAACRTR